MGAPAPDPVREFEHSHEHLSKLTREAALLVRGVPEGPQAEAALRRCLEALRDELLHHFAVEEEGLFPFIRAHVPGKVDQVDRLALAHDALCGTVVRLAHAAAATQLERRASVGSDPRERGPLGSHPRKRGPLGTLYDRFETAYALHSREEGDLLAELSRTLDADERAQLRALLHGL